MSDGAAEAGGKGVARAAPALVMEGVTAGYRPTRPIIRELDLSLPVEGCWGVLGPSGGGKTTLLRVALGALAPLSGRVDRPLLAGLNGAKRGAIGYIPQNLGLVRNLTVRENVQLGALSRMVWWRSCMGHFPPDERARAREAIEAVGLRAWADTAVDQLSGGQRRRVAIARALVQRPRLLLADEFMAELDPLTAEEMTDLLLEVRRTTGMTILFVDHDVEAARRIADRLVILHGGRKLCELDPQEATPARLTELYKAPPTT